MNKEIWKPVPDFPGYEVSDLGHIRSYWHITCVRAQQTGKIRGTIYVLAATPSKVLRPSRKKYPQVTLTRHGCHFSRLVHRLVLEAFVGPCPVGMEARHLDGDPTQCRLSNLSWGTHSENMLDRTKHGTNWDNRGENCPTAKLTWGQVVEIRRAYRSGTTQIALAKRYGVDQSLVSRIVNGHYWKHLP